ncbi:MAG: phenylacetate--CoA ligase family protein [Legionellales bacterium]
MNPHKYVFLTGIWFRNKKIFDCYNYLKQSESYDIDQLHNIQFTRLQGLLKNAYTNSVYYKNKFESCGYNPNELQSLEDLKDVPITSKEEVLSNSELIQVNDCGEKLFFSETSGSTGRPLVFYRNMEWDAWVNAAVMRGYSWHKVDPWEKNGYLWGYNIAPDKQLKIRILDYLQNRFRLFSYKSEDIEKFVSKLEKADYLGGYSSMLYEVAKRVNANHSKPTFNLKMIKGTSEKIYDVYQDEVKKAFGRKIISEYGSAESGIIAFECAYGNMHINMETVIVEEINNEIIVTNLVSKSFPIIRYKLGDYVKIDISIKCACGMSHKIIKEVTGRIGSVIYGKESQYPSLTLYYVFKNMAIASNVVINYQVVQNEKGTIDVYIENGFNTKHHGLMLKEFNKYFKNDVEINVQYNVERRDYSSKKKDFISNIRSEIQ